MWRIEPFSSSSLDCDLIIGGWNWWESGSNRSLMMERHTDRQTDRQTNKQTKKEIQDTRHKIRYDMIWYDMEKWSQVNWKEVKWTEKKWSEVKWQTANNSWSWAWRPNNGSKARESRAEQSWADKRVEMLCFRRFAWRGFTCAAFPMAGIPAGWLDESELRLAYG